MAGSPTTFPTWPISTFYASSPCQNASGTFARQYNIPEGPMFPASTAKRNDSVNPISRDAQAALHELETVASALTSEEIKTAREQFLALSASEGHRA